MNSRIKKYKAVIIGAGRIACGFDAPDSKQVLTHAHALTADPRVILSGITDIDSVKGKKEAKKWKTEFFEDHHSMLTSIKPDIVVIATPDHAHKDMLLEVLAYKPKVVILEKPAVNKKSDIRIVRTASRNPYTEIIVNFRRRFDPTVEQIRDDLIKGRYGSVLSASATYTKGVLHNGSHVIDLARYLFGEMKTSKTFFAVDDFPEGDPSLGGIATFERCPQFYLMTGDERSFYILEFEILTEKRRIRFIDEGRRCVTQKVVADTVYKGDQVLGESKVIKTKLPDAMRNMVAHAVRVADKSERSRASIEDALKTQEACYKLLDSFKRT